MGKYKDFDKFIQAKEKEKISFKMFGKTWALPAELPVIVILKAMNAQEGDEKEAFEMMEKLLGKKQFDKLIECGLTISQMTDLITWIMQVYTNTETNEGKEKKVGK